MQTQEKYADKIAKLLRKAENPAATPEEAEAFIAKAQELMTQYAIGEDLVRAAKGEVEKAKEEIITEEILYTGSYAPALFMIGHAIAQQNSCRTLIADRPAHFGRDDEGKRVRKPAGKKLSIIGFESDVRNVIQLDTSAQIQATAGLTKWWREADVPEYWTASDKYKARRQFLFSFAEGLGSQLRKARKLGEKAAAADEADRTGDADAAAESVALVVRSKKERVDEWMDQSYGKLRSRPLNYAGGGGGARQAGFDAGRRADLSGRGKVGGHQRQLGA